MSRNASDLLNKLRQSANHSTIAEAKHWLDKNLNDKAVIEIINEIECRTGDAEDIRWCAQWLKDHAHRAELEKALDKLSHVRVLLEEERIRSKLGPKSGRTLDKLLDLASSESIFALVTKWLTEFPDFDHADFVLMNLLRANPSKQHIGLAQDWLARNPTEFTSDLVLSKLIECGEHSQLLLTQAFRSLRNSDEVAYASQLACTIIKFAPDEAARNSALEWCRAALHGKEAHVAASMMDAALPNDEIALLVLDWCVKHPKDKRIGNTWNALLFNAPSETVFQACWEWLTRHKKHEQWEDVFWFLLHAAADCREALPPAATKRAWEMWEKGNRRLVGVLLEANQSEAMIEKLFSWVRSNPDETKTANTILAALLRVSPSSHVIEYSSQWIKSKSDHSFELLAVLRPLLELAPDADLIRIAQELLKKSRETQLTWSILELLIRTVKEPAAISRANQLVNIEAALSFRRNLGYSYGALLLALFKSEGKTPGLHDCARQWLNLHAHRYDELAASIAAFMPTETAH